MVDKVFVDNCLQLQGRGQVDMSQSKEPTAASALGDERQAVSLPVARGDNSELRPNVTCNNSMIPGDTGSLQFSQLGTKYLMGRFESRSQPNSVLQSSWYSRSQPNSVLQSSCEWWLQVI